MYLKTLIITAAVGLSTLGGADRADAQYRRSMGYYPTYSTPVYNSGGVYTYPSYSTGVYGNTVIPASGVIVGSPGVVTSSSYYSPYSNSYYGTGYGNSYYNGYNYNGYNNGFYNNGYGYGGYYNGASNIYSSGSPFGLNVGTSGVYLGGRRIGRW